MNDWKQYIKIIQDFPIKGITYYHLLPVFLNPIATKQLIDEIVKILHPLKLDYIIAIEARGFIFAPLVALKLQIPVIFVRKANKLPEVLTKIDYATEYKNSNTLAINSDGLNWNKIKHVCIIDDVLATGNTIIATHKLLCKQNSVIKISALPIITIKKLYGKTKVIKNNIDVLTLYEV